MSLSEGAPMENAAPSPAAARSAPRSILGVDLGSGFTKAALFEQVEGQYRLIARGQARTTAGTHILDGLTRACGSIEALSGRRIVRSGEPIVGEAGSVEGIEVLAVSLTCSRPPRVLATQPAAAVAARSERCLVETLTDGALADKVRQATGDWDAIVGPSEEVAAAARYAGRGTPIAEAEASPGAARPLLIGGDAAAIRRGLSGLILREAQAQLPGLPELVAAATEPLLTGASALLALTRLIASRFGLRLAVVDVGASHTAVAFCGPDREWLRTETRGRMEIDIPLTIETMRAFHGRAETSLQRCVDEPFAADLLLGTGGLSHFSAWRQPALTLLNGLQPAGVAQLALDSAGIAMQIGAFAQGYPDVACQIFEQDGLTGLGAAICPRGTVKAGSRAIEVRWQIEGQPQQSHEVKAGDLARLPLAAGSKASLSLYPAKGVDVGLNRPGVAATAQIDGGRVGLMVDARLDVPEAAARDKWEAALA